MIFVAIGKTIIEPKPINKSLKLTLDSKVSFFERIQVAKNNSVAEVSTLLVSRLLADVGGFTSRGTD